jgi:2'-5' RNA ligase
MAEKIRTFIAIDLSESVRQDIAKGQEKLRRSGLPIRWVRPKGIHLTLKFLGDIEKGQVEKICAAIEQATETSSPFTLHGEGIGVFPDFKRPRVVWVGISGHLEVLYALQKDLDVQLHSLGFPKEKRRFKGHLTLGRAKGRMDGAKLRRALQPWDDFGTEAFTVEALTLFQSDLRPDGAVYSKLCEAMLGSA